MKKIIISMMIAIAASSVVFGQMKSKDNSVETQIIALEKQGWEAWKNKDSAWYQTNITEDALHVHGAGVSTKAQLISNLAACEVKSVSLNDFKFLMVNKDAALITFTGMQDAVCGGKTQPATVRASSLYVKRGGKWLNVFYTEVPAVQ